MPMFSGVHSREELWVTCTREGKAAGFLLLATAP
uniref:Uncharacterized protein n=1 Tax=Anguilla anguilla TaxID=7936 RepID=A0A0E9U7X0_ANGAN